MSEHPYLRALREGLDHAEAAQVWIDDGNLEPAPRRPAGDAGWVERRGFAAALLLAAGLWAVGIAAIGFAFGWFR